MTATLATAAVLLAPFLAIVAVGALAVAVHDGIAAWWAARSARPSVVLRRRAVVAPRPRPLAARAPLRPTGAASARLLERRPAVAAR